MRIASRLLAATLTAAALLPPHPAIAQVKVIRAARMLDVASGRIVPNAVVVVDGGKIAAVNPAAPPPGAQTIDLGDVTLLPGLIDSHVHLTIDADPAFRYKVLTENAATVALRASVNARVTLRAGFTTVRDLGDVNDGPELVTVALARASDAGWIEAPRIVAAGHALSITGGHIDPAMLTGTAEGVQKAGIEQGVADGRDQVIEAVRYQIKFGAKVIKIAATAGVMSLEESVGAQQYSEEEMRAAVEEASRHGIPVAAHAHGTEGIKAAVRAGVTSIEHGSLLDDEAIRMMKERGTWLVPTVALADLIPLDKLPPVVRMKAEQVLPRMKESIRSAIRADVKIALGTDAGVMPHGLNGKEFTALVSYGMKPIDAIRAGTVNAAALLRVKDRGEIAPGLLADLVAVPGNPLENIRVLEDVRWVMKGGTVYYTRAAGAPVTAALAP